MKITKKIKAAYKEDLPSILKTIGADEDIEKGLVYCSMCGSTISYDNIGIIIPRAENKIEYICNNPECIDQNKIIKGDK